MPGTPGTENAGPTYMEPAKLSDRARPLTLLNLLVKPLKNGFDRSRYFINGLHAVDHRKMA